MPTTGLHRLMIGKFLEPYEGLPIVPRIICRDSYYEIAGFSGFAPYFFWEKLGRRSVAHTKAWKRHRRRARFEHKQWGGR